MSTAALVGVTISAAVVSVVVLIVATRRHRLLRDAHKLAMAADIELPDRLVPLVVRFQRRRAMVAVLASALTTVVVTALMLPGTGPKHWGRALPLSVTLLPCLLVVGCLVVASAPPRRRESSNGWQVSHRAQLSPRSAFTATEWLVLGLGVPVAAGAAGWGLWRVGAPVAWWAGWSAAFGLGGVVCWRSAVAVMLRPGGAGDVVELGWQDVLRFERVRGMLLAACWVQPILVLCLDSLVSSPRRVVAPAAAQWPFLLDSAISLMLLVVFRQGRRQWRQAWLGDAPAHS